MKKGYINAVKRFIDHSKDKYEQLELQTKDEFQSTPILLAALGSNLDIVKLLYDLGAKLDAQNAHGHSIVEIAALRQDLKLLHYLISVDYGVLNVWKRLLNAFVSEADEISASVGRTLEKLTATPKNDDEATLNEWKTVMDTLIENELIETLVKAFRLHCVETIFSAFFLFFNLYEYVLLTKKFEYIKKFVKLGALKHFYQYLQLNSANELAYDSNLVCLCGKVFEKLTKTHELYVSSFDMLSHDDRNNVIQLVNRLMKKVYDASMICSFLNFLRNLVDNDPNSKQHCVQPPFITSVMTLFAEYDISEDSSFLRSLLQLTLSLCENSEETKTQFFKENLASFILLALRHETNEMKELAVECIRTCSNSNVYVQKMLLKDTILPTLLTLLQKTQIMSLKMLTIKSLWSIAGEDAMQRKNMAIKIRVNYFVDFLSIKSDDLYSISCEALQTLFAIPPNVNQCIHDQFISLHGVNALVRALTNDKENIVLAAIQCIQRFCVRAGMIPFKYGQNEIKKYNGITDLVAIYSHAQVGFLVFVQALSCNLDSSRVLFPTKQKRTGLFLNFFLKFFLNQRYHSSLDLNVVREKMAFFFKRIFSPRTFCELKQPLHLLAYVWKILKTWRQHKTRSNSTIQTCTN